MTTAFSQDQYDEAYPDGVDKHWWCAARSDILADVLRLAGLEGKRILEVGAGRGVVVKSLRESGFDCEGVELAPARPVPDTERYFFSGVSAEELPSEQRASYEALMLLDVIEHIEHPQAFIEQLRTAFPNVKKLIIAVPASPSLWSNHDEFYGHFRRYDLNMLESLADGLGARLEFNRYFFRVLYPPLWLLKKLGRDRVTKLETPVGLAAVAHKIASIIAKLDFYILPQRVPGTSAVACINF